MQSQLHACPGNPNVINIDHESSLSEEYSAQIQWLGCAGYRFRTLDSVTGEALTIYMDPNLNNVMMPHRLKRKFDDAVVPSDASLVIVTHMNPAHMASAISLVLAAEDRNCQLACPDAIAKMLTKTKMIPPS